MHTSRYVRIVDDVNSILLLANDTRAMPSIISTIAVVEFKGGTAAAEPRGQGRSRVRSPFACIGGVALSRDLTPKRPERDYLYVTYVASF